MTDVFKFDFSNLRGDFLGGLTAGIVALPLALAFGGQTALGPMAGLYGAVAIAIIAALFGGTPTQVSGPTAPMTVVSASVIASAMLETGAETVTDALGVILATFFVAGVIEVVFGIIKLGKYIKYIPYPVVSGFMSGIGVIIVVTQIFPMLGYNAAEDTVLVEKQLPRAEQQIVEGVIREEEQDGVFKGIMNAEVIDETSRRMETVSEGEIRERAESLVARQAKSTVGTLQLLTRPFRIPNGIDWLNFALAIGTIVVIYGFKRITKAVPSSLVALILFTLVAYFFLPRDQVSIIGSVEQGLPPLQLSFFGALLDFGNLGLIFKFAGTLAALGAIDSLLTSVVADNLTKTRHDPNQELIGQGLGNMGAALIGGLPGAGATVRTVINAESGAKTKISGMIAGIFLLVVLLGLSGIVQYIPTAVLAGILFTVGIGIIDYKGFRHLKSVPKGDAAVLIVVLLLTVFVGLLEAVAVGMVMAALLFMKKTADTVEDGARGENLGAFSQEQPWADEGDLVRRLGQKVYIKHLDGPLFFGFVSSFKTIIQELPHLEVLILRMDRVPYIDQSGLYAIEDAVLDLQKKGVAVVFVGLNEQEQSMLERINLVPGLVPEEHLFTDFAACRRWLSERLESGDLDRVGEEQRDGEVRVGENLDEA